MIPGEAATVGAFAWTGHDHDLALDPGEMPAWIGSQPFTESSKGRAMTQSFHALTPLLVDGQTYHYYRLDALRE